MNGAAQLRDERAGRDAAEALDESLEEHPGGRLSAKRLLQLAKSAQISVVQCGIPKSAPAIFRVLLPRQYGNSLNFWCMHNRRL